MASKLDEFKIDAWLCPICSAIVTLGFRRHLMDCKRSEIKREKKARELAERKEFFSAPRLYSTSPFDYIERINYGLFGVYGLRIGLKITDIRYSERLSNTHDCPITGVTNWSCEKELPRGYPGYECKYDFDEVALEKFWSRHRGEYRHFWSHDYVKEFSGLHFGSGSLKYAWGKLFIDDFPKWDRTPGLYSSGKER